MAIVARFKKNADLESKARKLLKDATRANFWGAITLNTDRVFVSKSAADLSSAVLKAGLADHAKIAKK